MYPAYQLAPVVTGPGRTNHLVIKVPTETAYLAHLGLGLVSDCARWLSTWSARTEAEPLAKHERDSLVPHP